MDQRASPQASTFEMYRALVGIGVMCAVSIVTVFEVTKPIIEKNRAEALERAVFDVLPSAKSMKTFVETEGGFALADDASTGQRLYAGYGADGALVGFALQGAGMGYADVIKVLYGYQPDIDAVTGLVVLESKETPGLGDKIETDPDFLASLEKLDVSLDETGQAPKNPVVAVKDGEKTEPWQLDSITGATISSKAIASILRESTAKWVPKVKARRDDFLLGATR